MSPIMSDSKTDDRESKSVCFENMVSVEDKEERPQTTFDLGLMLLKKSSIYAVAQLGHSESLRRRIVWALVLLIGLSGLFYEVFNFLTLYFQYPVIITMEVNTGNSLEFPAVTVCNLNRMPSRNELCMRLNMSIDECFRPLAETDTAYYAGGFGKSERQEFTSLNYGETSLSTAGDEFPFKDDIEKKWKEKLDFLSLYTSMSPERRKTFGHSSEMLISGCVFKGEQCSFRNFSLFQSLQYGNCYTFNGKQDGKEPQKTKYTGPNSSGLDVVLDLEVDSYLSITESVGARVVIHDPSEEPNPESNGINISPGFETSIAIEKNTVHRLPYPYRDRCRDYGEQNGSYSSAENCYRSCIQYLSFTSCSCVDPTFPADDAFKRCNLSDYEKVACMDNVLDSASEKTCDCPLPCITVDYAMTISSSVWPSQFNANYLPKGAPFGDGSMLVRPPFMSDRDRESKAKVKVFYKTLEVKSYRQEPVFQDSELFSQLGGQMGIWMGLSLVAVFECVESVFLLMHFCVTTRQKKTEEPKKI